MIWESPKRLGFTVVHMNLRLAKRVIEVLTLTPDPSDNTRAVIDDTGCFQPTSLAQFAVRHTTRQMSKSWSAALSSLFDHLTH